MRRIPLLRRAPAVVPARCVAALALLSAGANAQLTRPGVPPSRQFSLAAPVPDLLVPPPDLTAVLAEDEARAGEVVPYRYGVVVPVELDLEHHGVWEMASAASGERIVWRVAISSPGAYSLGLVFDAFDLPEGAELFVLTASGEAFGALTDANEQPNGMLGVRPIAGDRLVLEYAQPADAVEAPRLSLESVVYDYRDVFAGMNATLARGPGCLVDINCSQGAPYQDIKRSVLALFVGGFRCSGALLNNTAHDRTPYMLTAEHCGDFTNGTFAFNYERPGCDSGSAPLNQFLSGATLLSVDLLLDSQIYQLNQAPPAAWEPFFAGWSREGTASPPMVGISHPAGLPKKLQIDRDAPGVTSTQWAVSWELGEIQGGSSGSPLFDGAERVVGPLCCGSGACRAQGAFYGRFGKFYARKGLDKWLDPLGTGALVLDGFDPYVPSATPYNGAGINPSIYTADLPVLGAPWSGTVDTSGYPGTTGTTLVGHVAPANGPVFSFGELLVGGARLFQSSAGVVAGLSVHTAPLPNDPTLLGLHAYTQAVLFGPTTQATNAVDLKF